MIRLKKSIGEAGKVSETRDRGIGFNGSVKNGILAVFIEMLNTMRIILIVLPHPPQP